MRRSGLTTKSALGLAALAFALSASRSTWAQAVPNEPRSNTYYAVHGAAIGALLGGTLALQAIPRRNSGGDPEWFPGDRSVRGNYSASAVALSNVLVVLAVAEPWVFGVAQGVDGRLLNASVVYAETLTTGLALNSTAKLAFPRPRPYSYALDANGARSAEARSDWNVSFYSGHASTAFSSAVAGSYLFAERLQTREWRWLLWGSEFALAAATANLRVRAGKHYYSDVLVGALAGATLGISIPLLHGGHYVPELGEYVAAGTGLGVGLAVSQLLPFDGSTASNAHLSQPLESLAPESGGWGVAAQGSF